MKYVGIFLILILITNACARVGRPTGGDKDITPPKLLQSSPKQDAINFKGQEIVLQFDEYVLLKDPHKNILISPPLAHLPVIKPSGIAAKTIKIEFQDSLKPQTTYLINFGESVTDFNEGNKLKNLQLVFSTGASIDSLNLKGKVHVLYETQKPKNILVGLYKAETFKDSAVFNQKPFYVGMTSQTGKFNLTHLKAGKYRVIALDDNNRDYKYKQGKEKIAFLNHTIEIPKDSIVNLYLFKEDPVLQIEKIEQESAYHTRIKFKGNPDSLKVYYKMPLKKSLQILQGKYFDLWYLTNSDSIKLDIPLLNHLKKYDRKRIQTPDSLILVVKGKGQINPLDTVKIKGSVPLSQVRKNRIKLVSDSVNMPFMLEKNSDGTFAVNFDKTLGKTYKLLILPQAVSDFIGQKNKDTIKALVKLPKAEKYGKLLLHLEGLQQQPVFVEILKNKKIIRKTTTQIQNDFALPYLVPGKYKIRIIFDANKNNRWDTGNYLKHQQPERTFEPSKPIEIRANWEVNQTYKLTP